MRIVGIDPGTAAVGFGVVERRGRSLVELWHGCLRTTPRESVQRRLGRIFDGCTEVLDEFEPDVVAIESLFFGANATAALAVGQARGVCIVVAERRGVDVHEYAPTTVKQAVAGWGRADKRQMQEMVRVILGLEHVPRPDHAADALGLAICHAASERHVMITAHDRPAHRPMP